ncbi:response regulator transcription factor [bacterium]|nr:response regulator transcription factor [bacterium]
MRIAIIDDSMIFRRRVSSLLGMLGHAICGLAEDCVIGAEVVLSQLPDVAIIDNELPDKDGLECVKMIRFSNCSTRIIVVSTGLTPERAMELSRVGADAMLLKPICESKLCRLLSQYELAGQLS